MAALDFPASPVDGQVFTAPNGVTYTWRATPGFWQATGTAPPIVIASDTPPASPGVSQQWFNTVLGQLFVWYDDGNSQQWVPASPFAGSPLRPAARFGRGVGYASGNTGGLWLTVNLDTTVFNDSAGTFAGAVWTPGAGTWRFEAALYLASGAGAVQAQLGLGLSVNNEATPSTPVFTFCYPGQVMSPAFSCLVKLGAADNVRLKYSIVGADPGNYQIGGSGYTFLSGSRINP
jgi:hypothetical protein